MIEPQLPENEQDRLEALYALNILDTPEEERFDRITRLAAVVFGVPIALVSLLDEHRQWFKSRHGLQTPHTPRSISFCGHTIHDGVSLIVPDTLLDPRFVDNPLVTGEPHIRFYAGYPIHSPDGHPLGTLCIIDTRPRQATEINIASLRDLAKLVEEEINKTAIAQNVVTRREELNSALQQLSSHIHNSPLAVIQWDHSFKLNDWSQRAEEMFGWTADEIIGKHPSDWKFVFEEDQLSVNGAISRLLSCKERRNVSRNRNYRKDGEIVHCAWHNSVLFDQHGALVSVLSLAQDVTVEVKAKEALRMLV
jgi:PAS domain S-box-containing protein